MNDGRRRPVVHGTIGGYQRCRPSCEPCRAAWNAYFANRRKEARAARSEPARMSALEALAAKHPFEFLTLYERASQ